MHDNSRKSSLQCVLFHILEVSCKYEQLNERIFLLESYISNDLVYKKKR